MSEDRRLAVLRAIIQDYVHTSEPVGSKALLERHQLGVSAATVRNDMASLEEDGLIAAPHTSAGRIPTDAGYRLFVNGLSNLKPLSSAERRAIRQLLEGAVDLDDILDRTVRLLASLTRQVAVVQYPSLTRSSVRHIELVPIEGARLLVVLITTQGRVEQRSIDCGVDLASASEQELLSQLRSLVSTVTVGRTLADAAASLGDQLGGIKPQIRSAYAAIVGTLAEMLVEQRDERVVMSGASNLLRSGTDFATSIGPVLEALEEQVVLLKLLGAMADAPDAVAVSIGAENGHTGLQSASLVSTQYGDGAAGLGVLGPTRMDYPTTMATVRAVATYVSRILGE